MVSIIIPTYNRGHLIGSTLDSIIAQTYKNWECIIVDDGSTDYTKELLQFYIKRDNRIIFYKRPGLRRKGANACRNFGFEMSSGKYIQWFDSDDLMDSKFLETKVSVIEQQNVDFVISKTKNFQDPDPNSIVGENEKYYSFDKYDISNYNYVFQNINWLTCDFLGKREIFKGFRFNEALPSAQERNFFTILTFFTTNGIVIDHFLTSRRLHRDSIRSRFLNNAGRFSQEQNLFFLETWKNFSDLEQGTKAEEYFFSRAAQLNNRSFLNFKPVTIHLWKQKRFSLLWRLFIYKSFFFAMGKGHFLRKKLIASL